MKKKSAWDSMTKEERSTEMKRRRAVAESKKTPPQKAKQQSSLAELLLNGRAEVELENTIQCFEQELEELRRRGDLLEDKLTRVRQIHRLLTQKQIAA